MSDEKRVFAVSFENNQQAEAEAIWKNNTLYIDRIELIFQDIEFWIPELLKKFQVRLETNWVVIVDDKTGMFSDDVIAYDFDTDVGDGRTNLQKTLDCYFSLQSRYAIGFDAQAERYAIKSNQDNSIFNLDHDEKGRKVYKIQWTKFTSGHRAMLLCVAGAVMEEPLSERWIREFCGYQPPIKQPPIWPVFRSMRLWQESMQKRLEYRDFFPEG